MQKNVTSITIKTNRSSPLLSRRIEYRLLFENETGNHVRVLKLGQEVRLQKNVIDQERTQQDWHHQLGKRHPLLLLKFLQEHSVANFRRSLFLLFAKMMHRCRPCLDKKVAAGHLILFLLLLQNICLGPFFASGLSSFKRGHVRAKTEALTEADKFIIYTSIGDDFDSPFSLQTVDIVHRFTDINMVVVRVNEAQYRQILNDPNVLRVEPDLVRFPTITKEYSIRGKNGDLERQLSQMTTNNLSQIQALEAHQYTRGAGVRVCIIDSGVELNHDDLDMSLFTGLEDIELPWNEDLLGHGTFMTGIINAIPDNNRGVGGVSSPEELLLFCHLRMISYGHYITLSPQVAPEAEVFVVRVFKDSGRNFEFSSSIVNAAYECIAGGARIINMSLAGQTFIESEMENFNNLVEQFGVLLVAAAGNYGPVDQPGYPASYPSVLSVVATNSEMQRWMFSAANDFVDVAAPGVQIRSTSLNSDYEVSSGTSIACAHVSGVAALLWGYKPDATVNELRDAILNSALDLGPPSTLQGRDPFFGHGLIQTMDAIAYLNGNVPVGKTALPSISSTLAHTHVPFLVPAPLPTEPPLIPTKSPATTSPQSGIWTRLGQGLYGAGINNFFGHSVALNWDGTVLAIGAPSDPSEWPIYRGLVRCFHYSESSDAWEQLGFDLRGDSDGDNFGQSVALSGNGNYLIVGADLGGYASVYEWTGALWVPLGNKINAEAVDDRTGVSVEFAFDAMVIAVGANQYGPQEPQQGSVRVMQLSNGLWQQLGAPIRGDVGNNLGSSISLSDDGHTVAVGSESSLPRVLKWVDGAGEWQQVGDDGILFGRAVAMNGNGTIVATGTGGNVGEVSTYRLTGDKWIQYGQKLVGENIFDYFGSRISLSSDASVLFVSAPMRFPHQGLSYLYEWTGAGLLWESNPSDVGPGQNIVAAGDGSTAAIGYPGFDGLHAEGGRVLVYNKK